MSRHTRKYWHAFHEERAQKAAQEPVRAKFRLLLEDATSQVQQAQDALDAAKRAEPLQSRMLAFLGVETRIRKETISPLSLTLAARKRHLDELNQLERHELSMAAEVGFRDYRDARAQRRQHAIQRKLRAAERKENRRIRYLEASQALRSAARGIRKILVRRMMEQGPEHCYYCGVVISPESLHLEHMKPISRGGGNRRNLVMSCRRCNLEKGRKTHDEYVEYKRTHGEDGPNRSHG